MKKVITLLLIGFFCSCGNNTSDHLIVKGNIKGLKKGVLYLKKIKDTSIITIDSLALIGTANFRFETAIETPEIYYLHLDKNDNIENRISFFGNKGITEINTSLKNFAFDAKIKGSKQQKVLDDYRYIIAKFNAQNLDLIKDNLNAKIAKDSNLINNTQKQLDNLTKRKYLYSTNFAITNKDIEVAPYIAITEMYNANIKLLDTINNTLTPRIKASKYGIKLQEFIDKIKTKTM